MLIDIFSLKFPKDVRGIVHLGAHNCEERIKYLTRFNNITDNDIIWIDALSDKVNSIKKQFASVRIFNECISNIDDQTVSFNITNNYQSSSLLKLKEHLIEHPEIYTISSIEMKTKTLKTFYKEQNFKSEQFNFFALDIQGAELLALLGAGDIINNVDYIYIEVNTKELYENCALLEDIDFYLNKYNFVRENILMTPHGWGDAFYVKKHFNIINNFNVFYGTDSFKIDITETVIAKNKVNKNLIHIPSGDQIRNSLYGDPIHGKIKNIYITSNNDIYSIDYYNEIYINTKFNLLGINSPPKKYDSRLSVMAIFKNETMNLKLWLDHYLWQGVEHFYLIDNDSNDNPMDILQDYIEKGIVSYFFRPEKYKQVEHYRNIFDETNMKQKTEWLIICDLDEFFFGTEYKLIHTLDEFSEYNVINTNSFFYGCDDNINHPKDIRISNIHRNDDIINGNKYIFKPRIINDSSEIWIHWLVIPDTFYKKNYKNQITNNTKIRLNHYQIQSLEYYQNIKMMRGDVSKLELENIRTMELFELYKKKAIIKDDILKNIIENDLYFKNGQEMTFYDDNGKIIDNKSIECHEQMLVKKYILEDDIVLELGARYGTVSCAINKNLNNKYNQISVEPDQRVWDALQLNKIKNNCNFNIIKGFISNKKLGLTNLSEGLGAYGSTFVEDDTSTIPSFTLNEIKTDYGINKFTALVADCEGFLEVFFNENPEFYNEIRLIIFERDYEDKCNYYNIEQNLIKYGFTNEISGHQNVWINYNYNVLPYEDIDLNINTTMEPNFEVKDINDKIYKFTNVINYSYTFCNPIINLKYRKYNSNNINVKHTYYIVMDCPGYNAFAHWIHESFIFFEIVKRLIDLYPESKIITTNKKRYVRNFLNFVGINNEIVYNINNNNNILFFLPLMSLNYFNLTDLKSISLYDRYTEYFINTIYNNTNNFNYTNHLIYLPRNLKDNFYPNDKISEHLLHERRNQNEIDYITNEVINHDGIILDTFNINNIFIQFSIIRNSKNIILDYGSSFHVNTLFLKGKNIIVLNPNKMNHHNELPFYRMFTNRIMENNNVTILTDYTNFEDIQKYIK